VDWYYCWYIGIIIISTPDYEAYKNKKMVDLSSYLMILVANGMFLWVIYGVVRSDPVIIGTNATGFALNTTLLIMKLKFDKLQSNTIKTS
jgi:MtN3 and saliva related transmembrane protein